MRRSGVLQHADIDERAQRSCLQPGWLKLKLPKTGPSSLVGVERQSPRSIAGSPVRWMQRCVGKSQALRLVRGAHQRGNGGRTTAIPVPVHKKAIDKKSLLSLWSYGATRTLTNVRVGFLFLSIPFVNGGRGQNGPAAFHWGCRAQATPDLARMELTRQLNLDVHLCRRPISSS
ncbi:hypothetical protein N658DRAFT_60780 [Parathielavia hyrcaniae]|uniref:Uncharacterized protein n=1 Tax=Parathielavia hyrcaniae TaxID=113614 RepID=A0AAN6T1A9_9PEZI|nr:hypothetical protein N658DRAFT_60780 [Parathielavia hyrcaniae]